MIPTDKLLHLLVGAVIGFTTGLFVGIPLALIVVLLASVGKEIYDNYHPAHTVDVYDALATFSGGAFAATVLYLSHISI